MLYERLNKFKPKGCKYQSRNPSKRGFQWTDNGTINHYTHTHTRTIYTLYGAETEGRSRTLCVAQSAAQSEPHARMTKSTLNWIRVESVLARTRGILCYHSGLCGVRTNARTPNTPPTERAKRQRVPTACSSGVRCGVEVACECPTDTQRVAQSIAMQSHQLYVKYIQAKPFSMIELDYIW